MNVVVSGWAELHRRDFGGIGAVARGLACAALMLLASLVASVVPAMAESATKVVGYHGYRMVVPAKWPVYHLTSRSSVCVRFDRHAVYLGSSGARQRCPANATGRTEAILVTPLAASGATRSGGGRALAPVTVRGAGPARGSEAQLAIAAHGVEVTATWGRDPGLVQRALGVKLRGATAATVAAVPWSRARITAVARPAAATVYTGLGFDACTTPSTAQMAAWSGSPYRALGVYIGGANMACSQPNLTASWVAEEWAAGWHLIPTYVGLQAPSNSCGCASIVPSQATAEGTAAAIDAVTQAQAVGLGAGSPIYFDMEGYARGTTNTSSVLTFLSAWTLQLHAEGYGSGVYSSAQSGVADLAAQFGTAYAEPDDIWIADWNGSPSTSDAYVPSGDWAAHQRVHQYGGAHDETFNGVTINVDSDYLDGASAFGVGTQPIASVVSAPSLRVSPDSHGIIHLYAAWSGAGGVITWRTLGGSNPSALVGVDQNPRRGSVTTIAEASAFPYYAVQAIGASGEVLGTSPAVRAGAHLALYGHSAFVPARGGLVGVPAGCFTGSACDVALTISAGRQVIARTRPEPLATSGGILWFKMTTSARALLAHAIGRRLAVKVTARDVSGITAVASLNLVPFATAGSGPLRSSAPSQGLRMIGLRDFVYRRTVGGILAGCIGATPCLVKTRITAGHRTVATTGPELLGANEAGYLNFRLSPFGRKLLANAPGNQLGVRVTITNAGTIARAAITLAGFN